MRVSLDLDDVTEETARERKGALEAILEEECAIYRTGGGFHIESREGALSMGCSPAYVFALRFMLGDDVKRLQTDIARHARGEAWDILFTTKNGLKRQRLR